MSRTPCLSVDNLNEVVCERAPYRDVKITWFGSGIKKKKYGDRKISMRIWFICNLVMMHVNVCFYAIRDIIGEKLYIDIVFWRITDLEMKCKHVHWKQLVPPGLAVTAHCLHSHCPVKRRSSIFDSSSNCSNMTDRGETMYSIPLSSDSDSGTSVKYCLSIYPLPL